MNIKEINEKTEDLIEKGEAAERRIKICESSIANSRARVKAAEQRLAAASKKDQDGNPVGDVDAAKLALRMAQNALAAGQRTLINVRQEAKEIKRQKEDQLEEIRDYKRIQRGNLEKGKQLSRLRFGENASKILENSARHFNDAEDNEARLQRSMGRNASPEYVSISGAGSGGYSWDGFKNLPEDRETDPDGDTAAGAAGGSIPVSIDPAEGNLNGILGDDTLSTAEKLEELRAYKEAVLRGSRQGQIAQKREGVKTLKLTQTERYRSGLDFIDDLLDLYRMNLEDHAVSGGEAMERNLALLRANLLETLQSDIENGTLQLYDIPDPDFDALAEQIKMDYQLSPPKTFIDAKEREIIREKIRTGEITEEDIRKIGQTVRECYNLHNARLQKEYDSIQDEQYKLVAKLRENLSDKERENLELRRKILMKRENDLLSHYKRKEIMRDVISQYRRVGPEDKNDVQIYQSIVNNSSDLQVRKAIDHVREYIPSDWVKKGNTKPIMTRQVNRGYFLQGISSDTIALSGDGDNMKRCAFHEMGHRMENLYPEILKLEKQFYERRTKGEALSWLGWGYSITETTRMDHFISKYMGKDYGGKGYELLSMGMESVFCGSYDLSKDKEYEELILGILVAV